MVPICGMWGEEEKCWFLSSWQWNILIPMMKFRQQVGPQIARFGAPTEILFGMHAGLQVCMLRQSLSWTFSQKFKSEQVSGPAICDPKNLKPLYYNGEDNHRCSSTAVCHIDALSVHWVSWICSGICWQTAQVKHNIYGSTGTKLMSELSRILSMYTSVKPLLGQRFGHTNCLTSQSWKRGWLWHGNGFV